MRINPYAATNSFERLITLGKELTKKAQVQYRELPDGSKEIILTVGSETEAHIIPGGFRTGAEQGIRAWKKRLSLPKKATDQDIINAMGPHLPFMFVELAKRTNVPASIIEEAIDPNKNPDIMRSTFALAAFLQQWYFIERAIGRRTKVEENDGRDLMIGTYSNLGERFVTDDDRFAGLLRTLLQQPTRVCSFQEFEALVLQ